MFCNHSPNFFFGHFITWNFQDEPSGYFSDDSDEDVPEELKGDFVDEGHADNVPNARLV